MERFLEADDVERGISYRSDPGAERPEIPRHRRWKGATKRIERLDAPAVTVRCVAACCPGMHRLDDEHAASGQAVAQGGEQRSDLLREQREVRDDRLERPRDRAAVAHETVVGR